MLHRIVFDIAVFLTVWISLGLTVALSYGGKVEVSYKSPIFPLTAIAWGVALLTR